MSRLDLQLLLCRPRRSVWLAAALLALALIVHLVGSLPLQDQILSARNQIKQLQRPPLAAAAADMPLPLYEQRYQAFEALLGDPRELNHFVAGIFTEAEKLGVAIPQGEYKLSPDLQGHFLSYQLTLPVRASYPQLRRLVDVILQTQPHTALSDIVFKRDSVGAAVPEASVRFVLYLKGDGG